MNFLSNEDTSGLAPRYFISRKTGKFTKKEILENFPDISKITVERTLAELVKEAYLVMIGAGPRAGYVREELGG
ncbi:MAG: hypothetical protein LBF78_09030, partial [Treponema sp.]|nr:hypothetical protein [Treponema sp.]